VDRSAKYVTAIVVAHLLVNIAHRELQVGLDPPASMFVIVVVLVCPLLALALVWFSQETTRTHSLVAFNVRIAAIRLVSPFSCCQP
jgi:hypothetical protein